MTKKRVLVACEFSGVVRDAFANLGHDAWSCDLLPTERPGQHIRGDVFKVIDQGWDLMIAHPPCTFLCRTSQQWLNKKHERQKDMEEAATFFCALLNAPIPRIAVENPVMCGPALALVGTKPTQKIQPFEYNEPHSKATCLWLRGLPPLVSKGKTEVLYHTVAKSGRRWSLWFWQSSIISGDARKRFRSRTFPGIAAAMASQWGPLL